MILIHRLFVSLQRVILPSIRYQQGFFSSSSSSIFLSTKGFAAAMAEALEKMEKENELIKIERKQDDENVKAIKEMKRKLKRRKWVDWQHKDPEDSTSKTEKYIKRDNDAVNKDNEMKVEVDDEGKAEKMDEKVILNTEQLGNKVTTEPPISKIKRRKFAMLLGYSGAKYYGMQRNPGMATIEEELFKAMHKHQWITDESFETSQVVCFQRAARTDKGVSAARQVCSIKLPENLDINTINRDLPEDIRLFGLERVTKSFNSKDRCDARTYTYTMPTISFSPEDITKSLLTLKPEHNDVNGAEGGDGEEDRFNIAKPSNYETFRLSDEKWNLISDVLKKFEGTKNFHNFTCRKNFFDPSAKRYIMSFTCTPSFLSPNGLEFITLKVKGQSFMLHQIRKMVGLVLAVVRGNCDVQFMERTFGEEKINLPKAPGLGLVLDTVHYDRYNNRFGSDGFHEQLTWSKYETEIQKFIEERIYSNIYDIEYRERPMITWLLIRLNRHSFSVTEEQNEKTNAATTTTISTPAMTTTNSTISSTQITTIASSSPALSTTPS